MEEPLLKEPSAWSAHLLEQLADLTIDLGTSTSRAELRAAGVKPSAIDALYPTSPQALLLGFIDLLAAPNAIDFFYGNWPPAINAPAVGINTLPNGIRKEIIEPELKQLHAVAFPQMQRILDAEPEFGRSTVQRLLDTLVNRFLYTIAFLDAERGHPFEGHQWSAYLLRRHEVLAPQMRDNAVNVVALLRRYALAQG
jgi:hypothetical protein